MNEWVPIVIAVTAPVLSVGGTLFVIGRSKGQSDETLKSLARRLDEQEERSNARDATHVEEAKTTRERLALEDRARWLQNERITVAEQLVKTALGLGPRIDKVDDRLGHLEQGVSGLKATLEGVKTSVDRLVTRS